MQNINEEAEAIFDWVNDSVEVVKPAPKKAVEVKKEAKKVSEILKDGRKFKKELKTERKNSVVNKEIIKADTFGFSKQDIAILQTTVFKTLKTPEQRWMALKICQALWLNPFLGEMWAFEQKGRVILMIGSAWWRTIIKRTHWFEEWSLICNSVFDWDEFEVDLVKWEVTHKSKMFDISVDAVPRFAYCQWKIKWHKLLKVVRWEEYNKKWADTFNAWNKQASEMLCNKAFAVFGRNYCSANDLSSINQVYATWEINFDDPKYTPSETTARRLPKQFEERMKKLKKKKKKFNKK